MQNIRSYLGKNAIKIIFGIFFIIFIYCFIHAGNDAYREKEQSVKTENKVETTNIKTTDAKKTIQEFMENCINGNYEKAYTYLSDSNKQQKYKTIEEFSQNFCENNSIKGKNYSIINTNENNKYKIELNNMLSSGKTNGKVQVFYCKVIKQEDNNIKISIER